MDPQVVAFFGIAALLTVTPGPDMALVTKNALSDGRRAAFFTTLGIMGGLLVWGVASAIGVAAVLATSAEAFTVLKFVGAAYLLYLGARAIATARHGSGVVTEVSTERSAGGLVDRSAFRQGFLSNLFNPKIAVFYTTFLPQFISPGDPAVLKSLLLAGIHALQGLAWLTFYAWLVTRAGDVLRRPNIRAAMGRITGIVLVGFGLRLALERQRG